MQPFLSAVHAVWHYGGRSLWGTSFHSSTLPPSSHLQLKPPPTNRYEVCFFRAHDARGQPIYHTNVMMSVGTSMAVVCLESVDSIEEREALRKMVLERLPPMSS